MATFCADAQPSEIMACLEAQSIRTRDPSQHTAEGSEATISFGMPCDVEFVDTVLRDCKAHECVILAACARGVRLAFCDDGGREAFEACVGFVCLAVERANAPTVLSGAKQAEQIAATSARSAEDFLGLDVFERAPELFSRACVDLDGGDLLELE